MCKFLFVFTVGVVLWSDPCQMMQNPIKIPSNGATWTRNMRRETFGPGQGHWAAVEGRFAFRMCEASAKGIAEEDVTLHVISR